MNIPQTFKYVLGGLYAWFVTVYFGAVLLDITYSRLLTDLIAFDLQPVTGEVADFLLLIGAFVFLCGLLAIAASWKAPAARNFFATSLLVIIASALLALMVLFPLFRIAPELPLFRYSWLFRLAPIGLGSLLGLLGFRSLSNEPLEIHLA